MVNELYKKERVWTIRSKRYFQAIPSMLFAGIFTVCSFLNAAWEPIGPPGGNLRAMARARSDESRFYAASFTNPSQIIKSTDLGETWSRINNLPDFIYSLAVDPSDRDIVYAGGCGRIFKSTNGGLTWNNYPVSNYNIYQIAIHPSQPSSLSASGAVKVGAYYYLAYFRSTNAGVAWTARQVVSNRKSCAYALSLDPADPQIIYIGGSVMDSSKTPLVFKSTDAGATFTDISAGLPACSTLWTLETHPAQSGTIYCGTDTGIYLTTDAGGSWNLSGSYRHIYRLAATPADPNLVFAGADTTIFKSTDSGQSWFPAGAGYHGREYRALAISRISPADIAAGNNVGFFRSTDGGSNWSESNDNMNVSAIDNLSLSRSAPAIVFAEIADVGEFKTSDSGAHWSLLPDFLSCGSVCGLAVHNQDPDTVFALEGKG